jgi:hypothetical protein
MMSGKDTADAVGPSVVLVVVEVEVLVELLVLVDAAVVLVVLLVLVVVLLLVDVEVEDDVLVDVEVVVVETLVTQRPPKQNPSQQSSVAVQTCPSCATHPPAEQTPIMQAPVQQSDVRVHDCPMTAVQQDVRSVQAKHWPPVPSQRHRPWSRYAITSAVSPVPATHAQGSEPSRQPCPPSTDAQYSMSPS